jgi:hypothetical protein
MVFACMYVCLSVCLSMLPAYLSHPSVVLCVVFFVFLSLPFCSMSSNPTHDTQLTVDIHLVLLQYLHVLLTTYYIYSVMKCRYIKKGKGRRTHEMVFTGGHC